MNRTLYRTRIKFCGMTRAGDIRLAGELGVDSVGFVFAHGSSRRVAPTEARAMRQAAAPMVDVVALFRDNTKDEVREVLRTLRPTLLQFHGVEDDGFCRSFNLPYLKAVPMGGGEFNARTLQLQFPNAAGFLFDSHAPGESGGSGKTFDWARLPTGLHRPLLLAGGITGDNVFDAIVSTLPWGVDVSSGIESQPGIKDGNKMRRFVEEVRRADCYELAQSR
ncbi:phosphoribosylanthranilate isomerase [Xanthomonas albilineans]|uniref:N-(5'-phosphoribosyl)anthranilate isomerase n=1 Tax=Xanthomonas albilineans (strain GPE PC73 / CFBP 7063) TaxID=380358 RepID=D2UCB7_XANAP|nr:phosphoribosylanthranilate isomerase [Xanthomonas albilineans]PPU92588.1 phosphoribosylanthranilate isomerase [Xanthomonas albilineans]QHQ27709.1 putative n-(5'-phosphoribosyl)anthranilate isomerase (ec) (prai) protein [Xanthomonas albilineans]CBA15501.1 probable n-(5'-phosphoribosyl)anthranilate isomerase (ec) (prai) protein [Xanthomonas albilineans GPE PC73]